MSKQHQSSSSSQIYILPPLPRRLYNLPAPVIHPPGSDPRLFVNPNLTASSMDVDPCVVASRGEIVAKEFDLTASEHAGVSLSESTTLMSTTSNQPTNTSTVVLQTVKDLVTTKTVNKNTNFIGYNVCNVTCNSEMTLKKHTEEKINVKDTQKPTNSSTVRHESPVTKNILDQQPEKKKKKICIENDISDQDSKKTKQDFLQKEEALRSLFVCDIPEPGRDYPKIVTIEIDESLFKDGVVNQTSTSRTAVRSSKVDTQNKPATCSDKHVAGKQHKNNLNISEKTVTQPVLRCEICNITCSGNNDYKKHQSGKKHIKNLQELEKIPNSPTTKIDSVTAVKLTKGEVVNPNEGIFGRCELCGVYCNSTDVFNKHLSGKKHKKNLKRYEIESVISPACVTKTPSPEPMIEEGEIVFSETSKRKANESSTSVENSDNSKKQKMNE